MTDMLLNKEQVNTAMAFDAEAKNYDTLFSNSAIGRLQRNRVKYFIGKTFSDTMPRNILELNCGTGEDALWLAAGNRNVLATDISEKMIEVAKKKTAALPNAEAIQLSFTKLDSKLAGRKFDFVFSNFGGLNCAGEDELEEMGKQLFGLTENNATVAFVLMSTNCWWENACFFLKRLKKRRQIKTIAKLNETAFPVWYYAPKQLELIFKPYFEKVYQKPVGLFIPPSYLNNFFLRKRFLLKLLWAMERTFGRFNFLANNADHYLMVFKKKAV